MSGSRAASLRESVANRNPKSWCEAPWLITKRGRGAWGDRGPRRPRMLGLIPERSLRSLQYGMHERDDLNSPASAESDSATRGKQRCQ